MRYNTLGRTDLKVSSLCFGALTVGPLQARMPLREGATVIKAALAAGVNFIDTAELYGTYPYIREALKDFSDVIVASKSYVYTYDDMRASVEKACQETGRDYIDLFLMHEQVSRLTLKGHREALAYLVDAKASGLIRAVGVSTHTVEVVRAATLLDEIDVIHPIFNMRGVGILDGTAEDMQAAIIEASSAGKGIYTMKALGGGHLIKDARQAINWVLGCPGISSVAVGMQSTAEVAVNCALFSGQAPPEECLKLIGAQSRRLLVEDWCTGCGTCQRKCPMGAITVIDGKAVSDPAKCVFCGYCGAHCPEFCLKVI